MKSRKITNEIAQAIGDKLGVEWGEVSLNNFRKGLTVELEHGLKNPETNITDDNLIETGKIALIHLKESPEYYTDLEDDAEPREDEKEYLMAEKPKTFNEMRFKDKSHMNTKPMKDEEECDDNHFEDDNHDDEDNDYVENQHKHEISDKLPKMMGGGLIELLRNLIGGGKDMEHLSDDDLDEEDPIAKLFKNLGGMKGTLKVFKIEPEGEGKTKIQELANRLQQARTAMRANILRHVFSCVQEAKDGKNVANNQRIAVKTIDRLIKDTSDKQEYAQLTKAKRYVLSGDVNSFDIAAWRVKKVFASYVPSQNIRVAYTTLRQQDGEPYQLCPKMRFQIGYAAPMEISKCREQCIDSKISVDGKVICAYADWVKHVADNQNAVNARLEVHKNPDKGIVIGTLAYPQRTINTKGEMNNTYEHMLTEKQKETEYSPTDSLEERLEKVPLYDHKGEKGEVRMQDVNTKTAQKQNSTIYFVREDTGDVFAELEVLPEEQSKVIGFLSSKNIAAHKLSPDTYEIPIMQSHKLKLALQIWKSQKYKSDASSALMHAQDFTMPLMSTASTMKGINPYDENLNYEGQIEKLTPEGKYADETIEAMLQDNAKGLKEKELDELMSFTNMLQKQREDTPKRFKAAFNMKGFKKAQMEPSFVEEDEEEWEEGVYCTECHEPCTPTVVDNSFDHAFGTEKRLDVLSDCCEAEMSRDPAGQYLLEYSPDDLRPEPDY